MRSDTRRSNLVFSLIGLGIALASVVLAIGTLTGALTAPWLSTVTVLLVLVAVAFLLVPSIRARRK